MFVFKLFSDSLSLKSLNTNIFGLSEMALLKLPNGVTAKHKLQHSVQKQFIIGS